MISEGLRVPDGTSINFIYFPRPTLAKVARINIEPKISESTKFHWNFDIVHIYLVVNVYIYIYMLLYIIIIIIIVIITITIIITIIIIIIITHNNNNKMIIIAFTSLKCF